MKHIKIVVLLSIMFAIYVKTSFAYKQSFYQTNTDKIVLQGNSQYKKVLSGGKLDNFGSLIIGVKATISSKKKQRNHNQANLKKYAERDEIN